MRSTIYTFCYLPSGKVTLVSWNLSNPEEKQALSTFFEFEKKHGYQYDVIRQIPMIRFGSCHILTRHMEIAIQNGFCDSITDPIKYIIGD